MRSETSGSGHSWGETERGSAVPLWQLVRAIQMRTFAAVLDTVRLATLAAQTVRVEELAGLTH